jgi:type II secretory ATPase GspE/PulE/Tfp pilus assembly ATPase PilB-like protein
VRFRIDGELNTIKPPEAVKQFKEAIVSRVKVMAGLDIAEKRIPQDGRINVRVGGEELDLRISVLPSIYGESVNVRLLNSAVHLLDLKKLGIPAGQIETLERTITKPHGIVLLTGPTGSGKTTTLYAALKRIRSDATKIITIEDPVEYRLEGITQIQVQPGIEFTFASGLRSMLRHDPDVMMVGEIRDTETARIATRVALTGHLVFSTLHTNDAASAITRLADMGIEPYLIASTIECVIAQRLVRSICLDCKDEAPVSKALIQAFERNGARVPATVSEGRGCDKCFHTGFRGRIGVFEFLSIDDELRELILTSAQSNHVKDAARRKGMRTLMEDGLDKVARGVTTFDEILRVTQDGEFEV